MEITILLHPPSSMKVMMMIGSLYDGDDLLKVYFALGLACDMMMMIGSLALACWRLRDYQAESDWTAVTGRVIFIIVILVT